MLADVSEESTAFFFNVDENAKQPLKSKGK
jgi:hypothetical protein